MGIQIEQGLYIARIVPGSTVAKEGMLSTGDRIICVSIDRQTHNESPESFLQIEWKSWNIFAKRKTLEQPGSCLIMCEKIYH